MLKRRKLVIFIIVIVVILMILSTVLVFVLTKDKSKDKKNINTEEVLDTEKLEMEFKQEFSSKETEYVKIAQTVEQSKIGKYDVKAYMPKLTAEGSDAEEINNDIYELSANIINVAVDVKKYAKYNMEYETFLNNNILSLVIRFTVKEEDNPRRIIIKTYNYDIEKNERVELKDIINEEQKNKIQEKIKNKVEESNKKANQTISKGYKAYVRDEKDDIYEIENATEFFIGNENILYIVYAYGNKEYTEEMDLIMHKL